MIIKAQLKIDYEKNQHFYIDILNFLECQVY